MEGTSSRPVRVTASLMAKARALKADSDLWRCEQEKSENRLTRLSFLDEKRIQKDPPKEKIRREKGDF